MTRLERSGDEQDAQSRVPPIGDVKRTRREIVTFIQETVAESGAKGVVVNLSGGIDSTVAATLATEALGSAGVYGLLLPASASRSSNVDDARQVAEELVIDHRAVDVQPLLDRFRTTVVGQRRRTKPDPIGRPNRVTVYPTADRENYREALGNATARLRMMVAYFEANTTDRLVLGTGNRTELLLGYFTKYGDGGVDLLPIGDLYKTHVRQLARHLDVPERIVEKQPTAGLWEGQADETELGAPYELIDAILYRVVDEERSVEETARTLGVDDELVSRFVEMVETAAHKRTTPLSPDEGE